jgi:hypothetical protein
LTKKSLFVSLALHYLLFLPGLEDCGRRDGFKISLGNSETDLKKERRWRGVKKLFSLILALAFLAAFSLGCAGYAAKESKVKCPKCGAVFTIDEGIKALEKQP